VANLTLSRVSKSVIGLDFVAIGLGILVAAEFRFGDQVLSSGNEIGSFLSLNLTPHAQAVLLFLLWLLTHSTSRPGDIRILGVGSEEYRRIALSMLYVPVILAMCALLVKIDVSRTFVGTALVMGTSLMFVNHWVWRTWLGKVRSKGLLTTRVALIGSNYRLSELAKMFSNPQHGIEIGLIVADKDEFVPKVIRDLGVPIVKSSDDLVRHLKDQRCQLALVSGTTRMTQDFVKRFSWELEGSGIHLAVRSDLNGISLSRLEAIELGGSPTFLVRLASFNGWKYLLKRAMDLVGATVATIISLPIVLIAGFLIWREDGGPMIFAQQRVGKARSTFNMYKLRSMRVGADLDHSKLATINTSPNIVMYKNKSDPRITQVGHFIRRWSIDELPQFWNVLLGNMSLVGPRPPLPSEVEGYQHEAFRRHLVKPGITGLWQVSGRNQLSWDETVRLDLHYVENWSLIHDLLIIMKTAKTVFHSPRREPAA
jgi:exopolysaccharide biosynthesis polyprenyl glycosylphosphotransferase